MAGDANYSNVALLLHGNGTNGSTTITDNSPTPKTATVFGGAQISTAQSKWGGASLYYDGAGDYIRYASHSDFEFGSGDFTVELWVRKGAAGTEQVFLSYGPDEQSTAYAPLLLMRFNSNNTIQAYCNTSVTASAVFGNCASSATFSSTSTWYHVAYVRSGSNFYLFVDGTQVASATSSNTIGSGTGGYLFLGRDCRTVHYYFTGYHDDVRITKAVARYTAGFTPPTEEFPDSSGGVVGTASTTVSVSSAGSGTVSLSGAGAATVSVTSAAAGAVSVSAAASATVGVSSAAAGSVAVLGQAATAVAVTSVAEGQLGVVDAELSGSTIVDVSSTTAGTVLVQGVAAAIVNVTSAADGVVRSGAEMTGSTAVDVTSSAAGAVEVVGQGGAAVSVMSSASGSVPALGAATSTVQIQSAATGVCAVAGESASAVQVLSSSAGDVYVEGLAQSIVSVDSATTARNGVRNFTGDLSVVTLLREVRAQTGRQVVVVRTKRPQVSVAA